MAARRSFPLVGGGLAALILAAWAVQVRMSAQMDGGGGTFAAWQWTPGAVAATWFMWVVMMIAMMLPTAMPFIWTYWSLSGARAGIRARNTGTIAFVSGYLAAWGAFGAAATLLQVVLNQLDLLSPNMAIAANGLSGAVVLSAGIYQFTPMKSICANKCRTPFGFLVARWRDGAGGAFVIGAEHGVYCVGCCWLLMATLFVAGVMSLAWMAVLTAIVLVEKLPAVGEKFGKAVGCLGIVAGIALILRSVFW